MKIPVLVHGLATHPIHLFILCQYFRCNLSSYFRSYWSILQLASEQSAFRPLGLTDVRGWRTQHGHAHAAFTSLIISLDEISQTKRKYFQQNCMHLLWIQIQRICCNLFGYFRSYWSILKKGVWKIGVWRTKAWRTKLRNEKGMQEKFYF